MIITISGKAGSGKSTVGRIVAQELNYEHYSMGDLQRLYAKEKGIKSGDVVTVKSANHSVTIPAIVQPGTAKNTIAIAVGYGRKVAGKVAKNLGANAFGFNSFIHGSIHNTTSFGSITKTYLVVGRVRRRRLNIFSRECPLCDDLKK